MTRTKIDWCDMTLNPVIGCTGKCPWCYARKMAHRFHLGRSDFSPVWIEKNFQRKFPRKPSRIFVNSMSDLADWEDEWYVKAWKRMTEHPEHLFLFLSKRPWKCSWSPLPNAMLGYSVTCEMDYERLLDCGYRDVRFLSIEPILEPVNLKKFENGPHHPDIRWLIVGSETGNRKGRVVPELAWLREIHNFAHACGIPLFFKRSLRPLWPRDVEFPQEYPV
jgi:protein gp37